MLKRNASGRSTPLRRTAASAALAASAVGFAWSSMQDDGFFSLRWGFIAMTALTGAAAMALLRRGVLPQVLARGVAWVVCLPMLAGVVGALFYGRLPDAGTTAFAATSGAALLLSWPNLHTDQAMREFGPVGYRRTFLAGAVAAAATGVVAALGAACDLVWGSRHYCLELAALAAAMLATTVGVVRMRAWGVLLGMVTSVAMLGEAVARRGDFTWAGYAIAALPGLLLAAPLLASRLRPEPVAAPVRVARPPTAASPPPVRVRVEEFPVEDPGAPWDPEALTTRAD
jgi:hypothetical protein